MRSLLAIGAVLLAACGATPRREVSTTVVRAPVVAAAPAGRRVIEMSSSIAVLEPVRFVGGTARLEPGSRAMLDAIAGALAAHDHLALIEVRCGPDPQLGLIRAREVVAALVAAGVSPGRLRAASGTGDVELVVVGRN